ncbi:MAG: D-serine ammonia-lyase [Oscillospiraceae bacterium]|nr:D-serine ammonia-lyase [Oscillospiraceae bacterium]
MDWKKEIEQNPVLRQISRGEEVFWLNPHCGEDPPAGENVSPADVDEAAARLDRFAPYLATAFPETATCGGIIESPLRAIPTMEALLRQAGRMPAGRLLLKMDGDLAAAGSVKARGGIYEVLCHAEELALRHGVLRPGDNYQKLSGARDFFSRYSVQVGSTGNLGLSIGIMSAKLGFRTVVHMSSDARQWKKDLLRQNGVFVVEYSGDYGAAVAAGRLASRQDSASYFVDDEHSLNLFLGYAVAARRLRRQLEELNVPVDARHPLFVTIPCGVGGAPGGITYGLRQAFGPFVHCFFAEPVQAPCVTAGLVSGLGEGISVQDLGLSGKTLADGLAVGRPSGLVCPLMETRVRSCVTLRDEWLYRYLQALYRTEGVFIEPSAAAAFAGPAALAQKGGDWLAQSGLSGFLEGCAHIVWATGGSLVPSDIRAEYLSFPAGDF